MQQPPPYGQGPYQQNPYGPQDQQQGQFPPGQNPYQPPGGFGAGGPQGYYPGYSPFSFKSLSTKTTLTVIAIGLSAIGAPISVGLSSLLDPMNPNVGLAAVVGIVALGLGIVSLAAMVMFFIWIYGAAENARALGNEGLQISPGWCIGWWFIPFASLVMPYKAMSEIWRSSDPEARKISTTEWTIRPVSGTIVAWWAFYLGAGVISMVNVFANIDLAHPGVTRAASLSAIAIVSVLAKAVSGVFIIIAMRGIDRRQQEQAMMLGMPTG